MVENTEIQSPPEKMTPGGEGKGKAIITSTNRAEDEDKTPSPRLPSVRFTCRNSASKYDFVKVKVWLGDYATHYYVLSRFLLSRMLTVTKIPNHVAIKISLELKKLLIDHSLLDVSQSDLEANLFKLMEHQGYGEEYINRYKMMTRFHHQRFPLVILVCGTACVGKSTIATQLAQRLNLPNVFQTDVVYELLRTSTEAPLASSPVWMRNFSSSEELITEFCRECRIVRKGLAGDLNKAIKDGKPIIIEGTHLDPSIYFMDDENKEQATDPEKSKEANITNIEPVNEVIQSLESLVMNNIPENKAETFKAPNRKEKSNPRPIIVPIMLKMAEFDHKALLEEWISTRKNSDKILIQDKDKLEAHMKIIQDYLCSFKSRGLTVVNISATTFVQTLDWLHGYLLQCIEQGISSVCSETPSAPK